METKNMFSLEGKKGFITGSSRGIGKTIAKAFIDLGADVAILGSHLDTAEKAAEELSNGRSKVIAYQCNVADPDSVSAMIADYEKDYGSIDFAVNNAGIFTGEAALDISPDAFRSVIDVDLNGVFFTAQAAARLMVRNGSRGSIISTASMSAHVVNRPQTIANYCAAKAGVVQLTKSLAAEWAKYGIRVNCVSPGYMQTDLVSSMSDMLPVWQGMMPEGSRLGFPPDLIGAYVYFASDASEYATGSELIVDGGYTLV
ncbi:MAG: SDR family oxidoreductase [Lachnospiraceae bacterium]|jgi:sorbose reductase|nr:SDR family oxidoreductase [Lachnospiraceae bacterium]